MVLSEDRDGPKERPLEHVAGAGDILEDVERLGPPELYWCFPYEREVQTYQNIHPSNKQVEEIFIKFSARKQFQKEETCI